MPSSSYVGGMRTSTIARSGSCSATTASSDSASPTRASTVARVLEQPGEPLAQEDRVLGDHESHGIATSRVCRRPRAHDFRRATVRGDAVAEAGETGAPPQRDRAADPVVATLTSGVPFSRTA